MPTANNWHDVNDPGYFSKPQKEERPQKDEPASQEQTAADSGAEVKLSQGKFVVPAGGAQFNKKVKARVNVEYLKETQRKRVTFKLFSAYNGTTQDMKSSMDGTEQNGVAEVEFTLFYNDAYYDDDEKPVDATVDYTFKASHPKGDAEIESEKLTLPSKGKQVTLCITLPKDMGLESLGKDSFTLFSTDSSKSYNKSIAASAAESKGNNTYELAFAGVPEDLSFTLEIQIDNGPKYPLFEELTFEQVGQAA